MIKVQTRYQKIIADYDQHCLRVARATSIDINESNADKLKRVRELEGDYIKWFEYYFPNYAKKKSAKFHRKLANAIIKKKQVKALAEMYRSSGKSVHIDMGIPLFLYLALGDLHFMLLVGETQPKANKLLSGIQVQLQYNHRIINDYGNKFSQGDWADGDFVTSDGTRFMALGFGGNPRGAREQADRPDYIVVDDVDNKKHVNNDRLMDEAISFITEDIWGCFDSEDNATERFVYANNNFHKNSITNRLHKFFESKIKQAKELNVETDYFIIRVDAVKDLKTFEPNWPEKTSAEYWRKKFQDMPYRSFMREYMNTHVEEGKVFKAEWYQTTKILPLRKYDALVFYGDLSFKDEACHKSKVLLGRIGRQYHIIYIFFRQSSRAQIAEWLYDLFEEKNLVNENIYYIIEGLFAMSDFVNDFDEEGDKRGYYIPVVSSNRPKGEKFGRIESMSGFFERLNVFWNEALEDSADFVLAKSTWLAFQKGATIPLDFLDALQGAFTEISQITFVEKFEVRTVPRSDYHSNRF